MPSLKKLKICKIESKGYARYCIRRGVDYLGVHVIDYDLDNSKLILCNYIRQQGGKAIVLTKETDLGRLKKLAKFYNPWALQLHYPITVSQYRKIASEIDAKIVPVFTDETSTNTVKGLLNECALAIYDSSFIGGTGISNGARHLSNLSPTSLGKVLLAGGITPEKIHDTDKFAGYDIQSYCRANHKSRYARLELICDIVKGPPANELSVSLTDLPAASPIPNSIENFCLEYQIDYSEGRLYPGFLVDTDKICNLTIKTDAAFTLHIFEKTEQGFQGVIDQWMGIVPDKIIRINLQFSPGLNLEKINTYDAKKCASIYYKDLQSYRSKYLEPHDCISFILPSKIEDKRNYLKEYSGQLKDLAKKEIWFDRKVDQATVAEVLKYFPHANFIAGEYILQDWTQEKKLVEMLKS